MPEQLPMREQLIAEAEAFSERQGISLARLATIVVDDGKFFVRMKSGGDCATRVYERFTKAFADPESWESLKEDAAARTAKRAAKRAA